MTDICLTATETGFIKHTINELINSSKVCNNNINKIN